MCCYSWGRKESDTTERLNWTDHILNTLSIIIVLYCIIIVILYLEYINLS